MSDAPPNTRLILLRHGEVHHEDVGTLYGQADVRLSERGKSQSEAAGRWLRSERVHAVYCSDLGRARFLASSIAGHHALAPTVSPALRERYFGAWQQLTWSEIEERYPEELVQYHQNRFTMRVPGGAENFPDLQNRVLEFLREILPQHRGQTIVIAAHSGPNRIILTEALRMPLDALFTFEQDYCCRNVIDYPVEGPPRVRLLNGTEHLSG